MSKKQRLSGKDLRRFWRGSIGKWRGSGLSVRQFRKDRGLSEPSFYFWRRTLTYEASDAAGQKGVRSPAFIEVSIPEGSSSMLELVLTSGNVLRIAASADSQSLNNVLSVLRESGLC